MKHLHMTLALISIALFSLRFFWLLAGSEQLQKKWVKITPHVIDTLLLAFGVALAVKLSMSPFEQMWLAEKIVAIFAYIFTGYYTLKLARNKSMQIFGYLGANAWMILVIKLAMTKQAVFF